MCWVGPGECVRPTQEHEGLGIASNAGTEAGAGEDTGRQNVQSGVTVPKINGST